MKCSEYQENLSAMVDGELASREIPGTLTHAGSCQECQQFLMTILQGRSHLRAAAPRQVPPTLEFVPGGFGEDNRKRPARSRLEGISMSLKQYLHMPVPIAASIVLFCMLLSASAVYWWLGGRGDVVPGEPTVVYMLELPPIDVYAAPGR